MIWPLWNPEPGRCSVLGGTTTQVSSGLTEQRAGNGCFRPLVHSSARLWRLSVGIASTLAFLSAQRAVVRLTIWFAAPYCAPHELSRRNGRRRGTSQLGRDGLRWPDLSARRQRCGEINISRSVLAHRWSAFFAHSSVNSSDTCQPTQGVEDDKQARMSTPSVSATAMA